MKKRIKGIDVARALAIFGMILVNFKVVLSTPETGWLNTVTDFFSGKAAATFVVLAGIGLALMTNSGVKNNDLEKIQKSKQRILKRALFLFVMGLSYYWIWPADILHFYGVYMALIVLFITVSPKKMLWTAIGLIVIYPLILMFFDYEQNWSFEIYHYDNFWRLDGFLKNLFLNGFHPVLPWLAFMLVGLWFGRQDLNDEHFVKKAMWRSLIIFVIIQIISYVSIEMLSAGDPVTRKELSTIIGTSPMPPLPLYMISGSAIAIFITSVCILITNQFENSKIIDALYKTGQLALTFYVAHVIIGMGFAAILMYYNGQEADFSLGFSLHFTVWYSIGFSICCLLFAMIWRKYKKAGPLEWIMRKLTD